MNIRPIRTEGDYNEALATVDSLWSKAAPGTPEGDHLDVLITLVQSYEREHHPIPPPDPIEAIKFRVEQMGIGRKGLEGIIGSRSDFIALDGGEGGGLALQNRVDSVKVCRLA